MRLSLLIPLIAVAIARGSVAIVLAADGSARPNVLMIAVDDMNDWISPLGGYRGCKTPNLERLAARGLTFTSAHTAAAACHPSRVAVMTGVRPTRSGIVQNVFNSVQGPSWRSSPALRDAVTLSQYFRNLGYRAAGAGKIYHALQWGPWSENDLSTWDYFRPGHTNGSPIPFQPRPPDDYFERETVQRFGVRPLGETCLFGWKPLDIPDGVMADFQVVDWATDELRRPQAQAFFLAVGIFRPHIPWEVPRRYFDLYPLDQIRRLGVRKDDLEDTWQHGRRSWHQWVLQNNQWELAIQAYLASITFADAQIGRLLDALDSGPHAGNTIIVLWSDHGMHIGEKENWEKFTVWEESTRVPFFLVVPGITRPGGRCSVPVSLLDLFPTLVQLTGGSVPGGQLDGESLVPLLRDPENGARAQPATTVIGASHGLRTARWRYTFNERVGVEELYDHRSDPDEFVNLAYVPKLREVLEEHRRLLQQYTGIIPPTGQTPPEVYELLPNGRIRFRSYMPMSEAVELARQAHEGGRPIPVLGEVPRAAK